jgi:hypothetical protein
MRKILLSTATLGALALLMVFAVGALADDGHGKGEGNRSSSHDGNHGHALFESTLAPSVPTDPAIHGVAAAGAPWVIASGEVRISKGGGLKLEVKGLVIPTPPQNGTNPVATISASLFCGADAAPTVTTPSVPFSSAGNAEIRTTVALPAKCLAPVVLLHPNGGLSRYIGASGFAG